MVAGPISHDRNNAVDRAAASTQRYFLQIGLARSECCSFPIARRLPLVVYPVTSVRALRDGVHVPGPATSATRPGCSIQGGRGGAQDNAVMCGAAVPSDSALFRTWCPLPPHPAECQLDPGRRVVAGVGKPPDLSIHAAGRQFQAELRANQQMIDAQACVAGI